ncbi:hypothetical protein GCM10011490_02960 [Pseudoclavibacter endophyticus]|uniref:Glycosyltransferase family 4 protein n=1 Tax=Pseudoclavibacter endophyticus TaxID=1778590 RepID=A0A6H9WUK5_9MICO|nr:glycosyltransferase family 1 protein [Pseudoclavibacter endophyticus]KAB1650174.1 glycosyltransferase family 4 protein [Pseudoclavibacter endophyticus]GGA56530.1 hypothetical protein GCM10011490_02960 [Pseudoclavibacter endophyticus]
MKLVFDCRYVRTDRHDGISRFSAELVRAVAKRHPVTMLISDRAQLAMLPDLPWAKVTAPTSMLEPLVALRVNALRPDVVFSPMQTMGQLGRRYGLILTIHDLIYYENRMPPRQFSPVLRLLWRLYHLSFWPQRLLLRGADQVAAVSATTRDLMRRHRLTDAPIPIVGNAPDDAFRADAPRQAPSERPSLVYMGAFLPYKNVETLARAMHELRGWTLHLCSRIDDDTRVRLLELAPAGSIEMHNGVSDEEYRELLAGATALATASRNEGFGLPLIEAMAAGTPVLCSDLPIFREVGGDAAVYADPSSPSSFASGALALAEPGEWAARSAACIARAEAFTWDASAEVLLAACREVADGHPQ